VWRSGSLTIPQASDWNGLTFASPLPTADIGDFRIVAGAEAPSRDEIIVIGVDENERIVGAMWDGNFWTELPFSPIASVSESFWWSFDVAYEHLSGDGMVVWRNGSTGTSGLSYRTWDGTDWSSEDVITTPLSGEPKQMRIAANPRSDEMVLVVSNEYSQDYVTVWNGSSWGDSIPLDTGSGDDRTDVFVAYEHLSGEALVVYGKGDTPVNYRVWDGSSWQVEDSIAKPIDAFGDVRWTVLGPHAGSDRIAMGVLTNSSDVWLNVWNGTAWEASDMATTAGTGTIHPGVAVAFENLSGEALAAYAKSSQFVRYRTWVSGSGWSDEISGPNIGGTPNSMVLTSDPQDDAIMLSVQDDGSDLNLVLWDGAVWGAPDQMESNTTETKNQPFVFLFDQVAPPSADLTLSKTVDNPTPTLGDSVTFTIVLTNGGPTDATGILVSDSLPVGLTYVSSTASQGSYDSESGLWTVGGVANSASAILTITCTVDPAVLPQISPRQRSPVPKSRR
jgi:uncharacterized repeat protein (TIGR01451 family)